MKFIFTVLVVLVAFTDQAFGQDEPYLDDRSDAVTLVRSLYNAINRKEYVRAWDYFGASKPASSYEDFAAGYADTESVEVVTGSINTEGAAGSIYSQLPVAILAVKTSGDKKIFAGCYTTRLGNPQIQSPPFQPLRIEQAVLRPASGPLEEALPNYCEP